MVQAGVARQLLKRWTPSVLPYVFFSFFFLPYLSLHQRECRVRSPFFKRMIIGVTSGLGLQKDFRDTLWTVGLTSRAVKERTRCGWARALGAGAAPGVFAPKKASMVLPFLARFASRCPSVPTAKEKVVATAKKKTSQRTSFADMWKLTCPLLNENILNLTLKSLLNRKKKN